MFDITLLPAIISCKITVRAILTASRHIKFFLNTDIYVTTRSKKIVECLANGIDPETGEILARESAFNKPQVIRALFAAVKALDTTAKRAERNSTLPDNAGHSWSDEEDQALLAHFDSGMPLKELAEKHGRTQGAIAARLVRLGRIKDRAELYLRPST